MMRSEGAFLPAAGHNLFLPLYDPFTRLFGFDRARQAVVEQAALEPHLRVLDVGCGTGTLAVLIKRLYPSADVVAVDPDAHALARARQKADRAQVFVRFDMGFASALGYRQASFDRVFSSLMFHHLESDEQAQALREMARVLRPGGRLEFLDFAGPDSSAHGALGRLLHSHRRLSGNSETRILDLMATAGFQEATQIREQATMLGRVAFYQASAPS
jgi:ubiquinone/menaquinone biosynthesis C-methylase UbiE